MGTATIDHLTIEQARSELTRIMNELGSSIAAARTRAHAALLSPEEESLLRRAEELDWLLND